MIWEANTNKDLENWSVDTCSRHISYGFIQKYGTEKSKNSNKRNCQLTDSISVVDNMSTDTSTHIIEKHPPDSSPDTSTCFDDSDIDLGVCIGSFGVNECTTDRELQNDVV